MPSTKSVEFCYELPVNRCSRLSTALLSTDLNNKGLSPLTKSVEFCCLTELNSVEQCQTCGGISPVKLLTDLNNKGLTPLMSCFNSPQKVQGTLLWKPPLQLSSIANAAQAILGESEPRALNWPAVQVPLAPVSELEVYYASDCSSDSLDNDECYIKVPEDEEQSKHDVEEGKGLMLIQFNTARGLRQELVIEQKASQLSFKIIQGGQSKNKAY
eukprot:2190766-Rhodomonas_salina.1